MGAAVEELSPLEFETLRRDALVDPHGTTYREVRRRLVPRYGVVWTQILSGHAALVFVALVVVAAERTAPGAWLLWGLLGAPVFGYVHAYIQLFIHEGAHYGLAPDRTWNDRLTNVFIASLVGQDIAAYRAIHFEHHRRLGTPGDTEAVYFDPLNFRFFLEAALNVKSFRLLWARRQHVRSRAAGTARAARRQLLVGLALNAGVVAVALLAGAWGLAVAWVVGLLVVFPVFAALRPLLEHRSEDARAEIDYTQVPHGAVNRLFGSGPIASTFGAAGFNRHLLHHWDPQVPCTRLAELERWLMETDAGPLLDRHRTTYAATFVRLFGR